MTNDSKDTTNIQTGGGAYVGGSITSGRDTVMGDQINITNRQDITLEAFRTLLAAFRQQLAQTPLERESAEAIDGDFQVVAQQAAKDAPSGAIIKNKLNGLKAMLSDTANAAGSVDKLITTLNKLAEYAGFLFP